MQFSSQRSFQSLSDSELLAATSRAAKTEKAATLALLDYLVEVDSRKLYASQSGCSSLFDYLVKILEFSHPSAAERVNAVRLIRAVPAVKEHLESGNLTLTSAAQIQRFVNTEQKASPRGKSISPAEKQNAIESCLGKSTREVQKTLLDMHSEPARILSQEKVRMVSSDRSELKFTASESTLQKLQQLKELMGNQSLEKIFDTALDALLIAEKKKRGVVSSKSTASAAPKPTASTSPKSNVSAAAKPTYEKRPKPNTDHSPRTQAVQTFTQKPDQKSREHSDNTTHTNSSHDRAPDLATTEVRTDAQLNSRFISIHLKRFIFERSQGQCEFIDPRTLNRCDSRFRLQIDHQQPLALGGKTEASNLRHLCSAHNLRLAAMAGLHRPVSNRSALN